MDSAATAKIAPAHIAPIITKVVIICAPRLHNKPVCPDTGVS
jgi:hypothetical protein